MAKTGERAERGSGDAEIVRAMAASIRAVGTLLADEDRESHRMVAITALMEPIPPEDRVRLLAGLRRLAAIRVSADGMFAAGDPAAQAEEFAGVERRVRAGEPGVASWPDGLALSRGGLALAVERGLWTADEGAVVGAAIDRLEAAMRERGLPVEGER